MEAERQEPVDAELQPDADEALQHVNLNAAGRARRESPWIRSIRGKASEEK